MTMANLPHITRSGFLGRRRRPRPFQDARLPLYGNCDQLVAALVPSRQRTLPLGYWPPLPCAMRPCMQRTGTLRYIGLSRPGLLHHVAAAGGPFSQVKNWFEESGHQKYPTEEIMAVLFHLDSPEKFSVYVDGKARAEIEKADGRWLLRRSDRREASTCAGTDVTRWILDQRELELLVRDQLNDG